MFAGQQPYPTWSQALPPLEKDPDSPAQGKEPVRAEGNETAPAGGRRSWLPIAVGLALGVAAIALVGFLGTLMMTRPATAPKATAAVPALASAVSRVAEENSNSSSQAIAPERFSLPEPPPIQFGVPHEASLDTAPAPASTSSVGSSGLAAATPDVLAPLPPPRPSALAPPIPLALAPPAMPLTGYDKLTAIYDITAHTVYLPSGTRLEAHSGLGDRIDDPRYVDERDRGPTPPHLYELTLRESLFHGVQALRLNPIGGGFSFNRVGLLAHPYMLGPNGDSNGCVSFKNYNLFLAAFQNGEIKRLAVVAKLAQEPPLLGRLASLRPGG